MNKTHVSILQEMMVKKGTAPNYELIHNGGGTHINTFTYRVMCEDFVASGTGRCKKDAKHNAAKNMLEVIAAARKLPELPATPADSPVRTPLPQPLPSSPLNSANEPFLNAIGELKDLCADNELAEPEYDLISDVGPPHARIFTYQCVVSTFREEARATTKKQAKHEASRKMLEKLLEVVKDHNDKGGVYTSLNSRTVNDDLTKLRTKKANLGVKLMDYHTKLKTAYTGDSVPTRQEVLSAIDNLITLIDNAEPNLDLSTLEAIKDSLTKSLTPLNIDCSVFFDCNKADKPNVAFVKITGPLVITECAIGQDPTRCELEALTKAIKTFKLLMN